MNINNEEHKSVRQVAKAEVRFYGNFGENAFWTQLIIDFQIVWIKHSKKWS